MSLLWMASVEGALDGTHSGSVFRIDAATAGLTTVYSSTLPEVITTAPLLDPVTGKIVVEVDSILDPRTTPPAIVTFQPRGVRTARVSPTTFVMPLAFAQRREVALITGTIAATL